MLKIKIFHFNPFRESTLLAWDQSNEAVVVDPGCYDEEEVQELLSFVEQNNLQVKAIWLTHGHFDHIFGVQALKEKLNIPVYMHSLDKQILSLGEEMSSKFGLKKIDANFSTIDIYEDDVIGFGQSNFKVIETPGHTPGGVCYYCKEEKVLFSGDTLFAGSIGRTDFPKGDYDKLILSIMEKLMFLDGDVEVFPGHGPITDIAHERTHNPFLQPFNEKEELDF